MSNPVMTTPYGVSVDLIRDEALPEDHEKAYCLTVEGSALMAGIYNPDQRKACLSAIEGLIDAGKPVPSGIFFFFGGHKVPTVNLPVPEEQVGVWLPIADHLKDVAEPFTRTAERIGENIAATESWSRRAESLLSVIPIDGEKRPPVIEEALGRGHSAILAAILEQVGEREIDCIEAAAFYALTFHEEWRLPAIAWLTPFRHTWVADWISARPAYRESARLVSLHADIPSWLINPERAA